MKGKAVVFTDRLKVSVLEVEIPEPGDGDVVVDVELSWISNGTESSFLRGERIAGDTPYYEGAAWPFPIVAGYQKVGVVRSVGSDVSGLLPGDRVFATVSRVSGMFEPFGGHVSPAVTPADQVWKLPDGAEAADYSGLVLTQVGYNCGIRPQLRPGDHAVVLGDGMVGHWAAQTLLHRGANVLVAGRHADRLAPLPAEIKRLNARSEEARQASAAGRSPLVDAAEGFAGTDGIAVLVDTVGDLDAVGQLLPLMKHDSHIVSAGFYGHDGSIDIQKLRNREMTLHAPAGWSRERMEATLEGVRDGWLLTGPLVTHRFPVDRAAEAWRLIAEKSEPHLGVILEW